MPLRTGEVLLDRYRIDALLGEGGMGAVYRGIDLRFDAPIAIKENQLVAARSQKQFVYEARLLYHLRHPNLPRVIDHFSIPNQGQYLVMDYIEGEDLNSIISRHGPLPQAQALRWVAHLLQALEYLHENNIIHRDVKPANIKITPRGAVFLVDFGLAKAYDPRQQTTVGARGVTPGYAPPEQYGQGRTDARSDIYSASATLYAMLTGQAPPDALECLARRLSLPPPRQLNPRVSPDVERAILRAMETAPEDRFQTAAEFGEALKPPSQRVKARSADTPRSRVPPRSTGSELSTSAIPIKWGRVVILAAVSALMGVILGPVGIVGVAVIVLGLLIYYAFHVLKYHRLQYQVEVLCMWLAVTIDSLFREILRVGVTQADPGGTVLVVTVVFWLPSALLGLGVQSLSRRIALRRAGRQETK